jgi:hypothetical protein
VEVELSRHAKNFLRGTPLTLPDVEGVIEKPVFVDRDKWGRPRYTGIAQGVRVRIVVAVDEPDFIVTIHNRRN